MNIKITLFSWRLTAKVSTTIVIVLLTSLPLTTLRFNIIYIVLRSGHSREPVQVSDPI